MKETAGTAYHPQGTVVMGRPADTNACVGSDFVVYGVNNFRVADLSIAPTNVKYVFPFRLVDHWSDPGCESKHWYDMFSNHPQSTAYLIGHKAAEAIIKSWSL